MSQENVEIVRRAWEAWERRDMESLFALYDPAIIWDQSRIGPIELRGLYHGHEGVRRFFREWLDPFEAFHAHAETFIDAGDRVVVGVRQGGRGKASGVDIEMPVYWQAYEIRAGLVIRIEVVETQAEALEAAGVSKDAHIST
jgi:ketosteroid isomerase-like protein